MKKATALLCITSLAATTAALQAQEKSSWADKIKLSGDVRLREEYIDKEGDPSRNRLRLRARIKAEADVVAGVKAAVGLRTGGDDPVSGNQTLGDSFNTKSIGLELASLKWKPEALEIVTFEGGKMYKPWLAVGDLVWDGDLNPEGVFAKIEPKWDAVEFTVNAGGFQVQERHKKAGGSINKGVVEQTDGDTWLFSGQAGVTIKPTEDVQLMVAGSYHHFNNMAGYSTLCESEKGFGNSVQKPTDTENKNTFYKYEYRLMEGMLEGKFKIAGFPVKLFANYVQNSDPDSDNKGYMGGAELGEAKEPMSFSLGYNYRKLEKDAVVGALADSDSWGGGTDGKGHKLSGAFQIAKNWQLGATYFINDAGISGASKTYKRLQVDLSAKF